MSGVRRIGVICPLRNLVKHACNSVGFSARKIEVLIEMGDIDYGIRVALASGIVSDLHALRLDQNDASHSISTVGHEIIPR